MTGVHYHLDREKGVVRVLSPHVGDCIPYFVERDGAVFLCVMEGAAYHQYQVNLAGVARLVAESGRVLWRQFGGGS